MSHHRALLMCHALFDIGWKFHKASTRSCMDKHLILSGNKDRWILYKVWLDFHRSSVVNEARCTYWGQLTT